MTPFRLAIHEFTAARRRGHTPRDGAAKRLKQFGWIYRMTRPAPNVLYVAELLKWRVQKLMLAA